MTLPAHSDIISHGFFKFKLVCEEVNVDRFYPVLYPKVSSGSQIFRVFFLGPEVWAFSIWLDFFTAALSNILQLKGKWWNFIFNNILQASYYLQSNFSVHLWMGLRFLSTFALKHVSKRKTRERKEQEKTSCIHRRNKSYMQINIIRYSHIHLL